MGPYETEYNRLDNAGQKAAWAANAAEQAADDFLEAHSTRVSLGQAPSPDDRGMRWKSYCQVLPEHKAEYDRLRAEAKRLRAVAESMPHPSEDLFRLMEKERAEYWTTLGTKWLQNEHRPCPEHGYNCPAPAGCVSYFLPEDPFREAKHCSVKVCPECGARIADPNGYSEWGECTHQRAKRRG